MKNQQLLDRIKDGQRIMCLHALGQSLVDALVDIIKEQDKLLENDVDEEILLRDKEDEEFNSQILRSSD